MAPTKIETTQAGFLATWIVPGFRDVGHYPGSVESAIVSREQGFASVIALRQIAIAMEEETLRRWPRDFDHPKNFSERLSNSEQTARRPCHPCADPASNVQGSSEPGPAQAFTLGAA